MPITLVKSLRGDHVSDLRLRPVLRVAPEDSIEQVVRVMAEQRTGCALVMRDGQLDGIFTERDFLTRVVAANLDVALSVERVMTPQPKTSRLRETVYEAVELMERGGYRHLPILDEDGRPVGVLSVKDIMNYLVGYFPAKVYNLPPTPVQTQPAREGA